MKKGFLLLLLSIITLGLTAQSKWSSGISVQAGYSGESDEVSSYRSTAQSGDRAYLYNSKVQPSAGAGIWVERQLANRWGIYLGLDYLQLNTYWRSERTSFTTEQLIFSYSYKEFGVDQRQLQAPLKVHFYFGKPYGHRRPFISSGIQTQYLLKQTNFYEEYDETFGFHVREDKFLSAVDVGDKSSGYNRLQYGLNVGIGVKGRRVILSLRHSWSIGDNTSRRTDLQCGHPLGQGCFGPQSIGTFVNQLQQTSFRFQYRLY